MENYKKFRHDVCDLAAFVRKYKNPMDYDERMLLRQHDIAIDSVDLLSKLILTADEGTANEIKEFLKKIEDTCLNPV